MDGWENKKTGSRSRRRRQDSCQNCLVYFGINLFMMPMVMVVSLLACLPVCHQEFFAKGKRHSWTDGR